MESAVEGVEKTAQRVLKEVRPEESRDADGTSSRKPEPLGGRVLRSSVLLLRTSGARVKKAGLR